MYSVYFLFFIAIFIAYVESLQKKALIKVLEVHQYTLVKMKTTKAWFQFPGGPVIKPGIWTWRNPYAIKAVTFTGKDGAVVECLVAIVSDKGYKPGNLYFSIDLETLQPVQTAV